MATVGVKGLQSATTFIALQVVVSVYVVVRPTVYNQSVTTCQLHTGFCKNAEWLHLTVGVDKPGQCPRPRPGTGGICVNLCSCDDDCKRDLKCCSNGCGHTCQKPSELYRTKLISSARARDFMMRKILNSKVITVIIIVIIFTIGGR